jgi:hypothetical protein
MILKELNLGTTIKSIEAEMSGCKESVEAMKRNFDGYERILSERAAKNKSEILKKIEETGKILIEVIGPILVSLEDGQRNIVNEITDSMINGENEVMGNIDKVSTELGNVGDKFDHRLMDMKYTLEKENIKEESIFKEGNEKLEASMNVIIKQNDSSLELQDEIRTSIAK